MRSQEMHWRWKTPSRSTLQGENKEVIDHTQDGLKQLDVLQEQVDRSLRSEREVSALSQTGPDGPETNGLQYG